MKDLEELIESGESQTRLLWHHDYWDGPMTGVMLWEGEKCWFEMVEEKHFEVPLTEEEINEWADYLKISVDEVEDVDKVDWDRIRWFDVYRIPKEIMESIEYNHELFRKYVGAHTDYDEEGNRHHNLSDYGEYHKYYNDRKSHKE